MRHLLPMNELDSAIRHFFCAAGAPALSVWAKAPVTVVSRYRPEYDVTYRLRAPLRLARGSRVDIRASSPECTATLDYVARRD